MLRANRKQFTLFLVFLVTGMSTRQAPADRVAVSQPTVPASFVEHNNAIRFRGNSAPLNIQFPVTITARPEYQVGSATISAMNVEIAAEEINLTDGRGTAGINIPEKFFNRAITLRIACEFSHQDSETGLKYSSQQDVLVWVDKEAPEALTPIQVERFPGGGGYVYITFKDDDLNVESVGKSSFTVVQKAEGQNSSVNSGNTTAFDITIPQHRDPELDSTGRRVTLTFANLNPGKHEVTLKSSLKDKIGNSLVEKVIEFAVPDGAQFGEQVEFPRFLQPGNAVSEFVPGDRVDTRTIQLYYFRDARRVAELINRNIRALNQTGYDQAQQFARQARIDAETAIDERRYQETLAVNAAQQTREMENRIAELQRELEQAQTHLDRLAIEEAQLNTVVEDEGADGNADAIALDAEINKTRAEIVQLNSEIKTLEADLAEEQAIAANLRAAELKFASSEADLKAANERLALALRTNPTNTELIDFLRMDVATAEKAHANSNAALQKATQENQVVENARMQLPAKKGDRVNATNRLQSLLTLQARKTLNGEQKSRTKDRITAILNDINSLGSQVSDLQNREIDARNTLLQREASELRTSEERFRREVIAGLTDPDVFVPGKVESKDPVTQVSISVVGTSRIHLRGPIKGINKIARMIHQLDTPVGQVKVGIHTVQVNGEHGDRMDFVYERIQREIQHSRFLVNQSGQLLRRAVHEVAAEVALAIDQGFIPDGCPPELAIGAATLNGNVVVSNQELRDRRYLYAFFGSDFIRELEAMDSELLNTENKMLSLHSMDTISLAGALTVTSLADHPVRARILQRFQELVGFDLPESEVKYVNSLTHVTKRGKTLQGRFRKAMHLDAKDAEEIYFNASRTYHFPNTVAFFNHQIPGEGTLNPVQYATIKMAQTLKAQLIAEMEYQNLVLERSLIEKKDQETEANYIRDVRIAEQAQKTQLLEAKAVWLSIVQIFVEMLDVGSVEGQSATQKLSKHVESDIVLLAILKEFSNKVSVTATSNRQEFVNRAASEIFIPLSREVLSNDLRIQIGKAVAEAGRNPQSQLGQFFDKLSKEIADFQRASLELEIAEQDVLDGEERLYSQRLLEHFMDEQEEKSVELMEALRAHASNVDNYLKRVSTALEDDVAAQFYEPAFQRIRRVSRSWDVTLGQIETTTILTNNRTLAKVDPTATFEFDLPPRDILINEAFEGAEALAKDYGNLLNDGTFLAGTALLSTQPAAGVIGENNPMQVLPGVDSSHQFGSNLQQLIPDPAIHKFETGTGFEIRPVIQPDGHSIVYTFDYLYSTNVREPVRADEKHLGRIKRHFVHTDVQTSSYELREISKYTVALKAARTSRGVPLLEDVPGVGVLFRPLPSDESSLQTNIILGSSVIYPTMFDLMGLRWSRYVDDLSSPILADEKNKQASRRDELRSHLLRKTRGLVNEHIGLPTPESTRPRLILPGYKK